MAGRTLRRCVPPATGSRYPSPRGRKRTGQAAPGGDDDVVRLPERRPTATRARREGVGSWWNERNWVLVPVPLPVGTGSRVEMTTLHRPDFGPNRLQALVDPQPADHGVMVPSQLRAGHDTAGALNGAPMRRSWWR